jgi:transcriptional regulator with AAA-type ATPase domain
MYTVVWFGELAISSWAPIASGGGFTEQVARFSRRLLERALTQAGGNRAEAARRPGLSYDQFRHHHRKHFGGDGKAD